MSIERSIHQRWSAHCPLTRLVPAERFCTGVVPERDALGASVEPPYVVLRLEGSSAGQELIRTSKGTLLVRSSCEFLVYCTTAEEARQISEEIRACFTSAEFDWDHGRVQDMRPAAATLEQLNDGSWRAVREFTIRHETRK